MEDVGFWTVHGLLGGMLFLALATVFPRIHMFLGGLVFAAFSLSVLMPSVIVCILWLFLPRLLIAYAASMFYWDTNPVLVFIAWCIAIGLEVGEKLLVGMAVTTS